MSRLWSQAREVVGLWLFLGSVSLSLNEALSVRVDEEYNITAGHAMLLPCGGAEEREKRGSVRVGGPPLDAIPDLQLKNDTLWFLPAQVNHTGVYDCSGKYAYYIGLNVGSGPCPEADNVRSSKRGDFFRLDCEDTMNHITRVFSPSFVTWLKECKPLAKGTIIDLKLQIENVQPVDGGRYTCVLGFTHEGRNYTSARTTTVTVEAPIRRLKPEIIVPLNETRAVKMGSQQELRCEATGMPDEITTVIWQINGTPDEIMNSPDFTVSKVHGNTSVLTIIEVKTKFLNVPFTCLAQNRLGSAISTLVLTEANEGHPSWLVAIICLCVLLVVCALLWQFFKVDLVLLYRSLCPRQHKDTDGSGE